MSKSAEYEDDLIFAFMGEDLLQHGHVEGIIGCVDWPLTRKHIMR